LKGTDHLEDPGIYRRTIIKWEGVNYILPAKDRSKWESLVSVVINLQVL
jgi:hypothetical protein